jgi:hypothetical protein
MPSVQRHPVSLRCLSDSRPSFPRRITVARSRGWAMLFRHDVRCAAPVQCVAARPALLVARVPGDVRARCGRRAEAGVQPPARRRGDHAPGILCRVRTRDPVCNECDSRRPDARRAGRIHRPGGTATDARRYCAVRDAGSANRRARRAPPSAAGAQHSGQTRFCFPQSS